MSCWPVILREVRDEARRPINHWLRVVGGGVVVVGVGWFVFNHSISAGQMGAVMFRYLSTALSVAIAILAPFLTADSISREKREGTLGLLFLTPLAPRDVLLGKGMIHAIRAVTILLAAFPVMAFPFVLGGVNWTGLLGLILSNLTTIFVGLTIGLYASTRYSSWLAAVAFAEFLMAIYVLVPMFLLTFLWPLTPRWLIFSWYWPAVPLAVGWFIFYRAQINLTRNWQKDLGAPPQPSWVKIFSTSAFWKELFRWDKSKTLDRNPIAWLQEYSWTARLTKWGWCILVLAIEMVIVFFSGRTYMQQQIYLSWILEVGIAFTAASSFRSERQSGALELLLVTPIQARQLIVGRLWGLWAHFFPAAAIVLFLWIFTPFYQSRRAVFYQLLLGTSFFTLPILGLYFSLLRSNFIFSWLATCVIGIVLPTQVFQLLRDQFANAYQLSLWDCANLASGLQLAIGAAFALLLYRSLAERRFAFHGVTA